MSPLRDVRVLDVGGGVAGAWCARLLGGLGAEVLKVEPPGGDPTRLLGPPLPDGPPHALFRFLNAAKRSVALDHAAPADRARLADLIRHCDVLVETLCPGTLAAWGLDPVELRDAQPALVVVSLTPFGQQGPRRTWRADEAVLQAEVACSASPGDRASRHGVWAASRRRWLPACTGPSPCSPRWPGAPAAGSTSPSPQSSPACSKVRSRSTRIPASRAGAAATAARIAIP